MWLETPALFFAQSMPNQLEINLRIGFLTLREVFLRSVLISAFVTVRREGV